MRLIHIDDDELLYSPQSRKIGERSSPCVLLGYLGLIPERVMGLLDAWEDLLAAVPSNLAQAGLIERIACQCLQA